MSIAVKKYEMEKGKDVYKIVTGDESFIYAYEPETKQLSTLWIIEVESNPTRVVRGTSTTKQMVACFFRKTRPVVTVPLEHSKTANSEWYTTIGLLKSSEKFEKRTRTDESLFKSAPF